MTSSLTYDLIVIGGGVNGAGIARDAAGRGLSVLLIEQGDLASATSSASSKMIHGGLRYLETGQFRLVREALAEREVLQRLAPHLVRPMRFVLPHAPHLRSAWKIRFGLWLYDHLNGPSSFPRSGPLDLREGREGAPLLTDFRQGFHYSDAITDDARLAVLNAMDAAARGATLRTHCRAEALWTEGNEWRVRMADTWRAHTEVAAGRVLVNAAGPWVDEVLKMARPEQAVPHLRLVKGSHLIVPRIYEGEYAYLYQNTDGRVIFFWPFERDFTLIGTTDVPFAADPQHVSCSAEEEAYLLRAAAAVFRHPPSPISIVHRFAGVRALYDDGRADAKDVSRDYVLKHEPTALAAPMLSIYGGKLTTYRVLAEAVLHKLAVHFPGLKPSWTAHAPLPGGDLGMPYEDFVESMEARYPWVESHLRRRLCRTYGTRIEAILQGGQTPAALGLEVVPGLFEAELHYLRAHEFARTAADILWRRGRLGLRLGRAEADRLAEWLARA